jgi:hypothetical protein
MWTFLQFCVSVAAGAFVWFDPYWIERDLPMPRLWGTIIVGVAAAWLFTFVVTWIRFGWKAARTMRFFSP